MEFRKEQLSLQGDCCFWCDKAFGSRVFVRGKKRVLRPEWDHLIPFSYNQNNAPHNFVAACQICNNWKAALMFPTVQECREFLQIRWVEFLE